LNDDSIVYIGRDSYKKEVIKMAINMPNVVKCEVQDCSYNRNRECHALAITIGDERTHAMCDTYVKADHKGGVMDSTGKVGACKADGCKFNTDLECSAKNISVGLHQGHADCMTFSAK
jgi:hypothetical protein